MKLLTLIFSILSLNFLFAQEKVKYQSIEPHESIKLKIPTDWVVMEDDDIAARYTTARKPTAVYTNSTKEIDFDVNITINTWGGDLAILKDFYKSTILNLHKRVEFINEKVITIKKRDFVWLEYTSAFDDKGNTIKKHYSNMMFTVVDGRIVVYSFRCDQKLKDNFQQISNTIFSTVKMKNTLNLPVEEGKPYQKMPKEDTKSNTLEK